MRLKVLEAIAEFTGLALDREILEKLAPQLQETLVNFHFPLSIPQILG